MARVSNPNSSAEKAARAIDRNRERERRHMMQSCHKYADELAIKLVQRLLDDHIIETTSESSLREIFIKVLNRLSEMEEFDLQYKIAPVRALVNDPNFITLYLTQYIIEELIDHPHVQDIYGDDLEIYRSVNTVMDKIRPH